MKFTLLLSVVSPLLGICSAYCQDSTGHQISTGPNHDGYGESKDGKHWVWWDKCSPWKPVPCKPMDKLKSSCSAYIPFSNEQDQGQMQANDLAIAMGDPVCRKGDDPLSPSDTGYIIDCIVPPSKYPQLARETLSKIYSPALPVLGYCKYDESTLQVETSCVPPAAREFCLKEYGGDANNQTWPIFNDIPPCKGFPPGPQ